MEYVTKSKIEHTKHGTIFSLDQRSLEKNIYAQT